MINLLLLCHSSSDPKIIVDQTPKDCTYPCKNKRLQKHQDNIGATFDRARRPFFYFSVITLNSCKEKKRIGTTGRPVEYFAVCNFYTLLLFCIILKCTHLIHVILYFHFIFAISITMFILTTILILFLLCFRSEKDGDD